MARPTKYDPAFCDQIVALGETGASVVEMAYELGVVKQSLYEWEGVHPEFSDAFTRARAASQVWWERKGRTGMERSASEFQGSIWSRSMAARFPEDWREKTEMDVSLKSDIASAIEQGNARVKG